MKYFLIIIALSVWQEIEFLLENGSYHDADAVKKEINTLAHNNGIDYDFSVRTPQPFGVRVREGFKSLVFALFPWTLVVRFQNAFNIGMKEKPRPRKM